MSLNVKNSHFVKDFSYFVSKHFIQIRAEFNLQMQQNSD